MKYFARDELETFLLIHEKVRDTWLGYIEMIAKLALSDMALTLFLSCLFLVSYRMIRWPSFYFKDNTTATELR